MVFIAGCGKQETATEMRFPMAGQAGQMLAAKKDAEFEAMEKKAEGSAIQFAKDIEALKQHNPFSPPIVETIEVIEEKLKLTFGGVIWSGTTPSAIINDEIVNVGDFIEGAKVINISEKSVLLIKDDTEYKLELEF